MAREVVSWRLLQEEAADGAANMAEDRALLDVMEQRLAGGGDPQPILRLYGWSPPTVSVGRHQDMEAACDLSACAAAGVDVVRRPTGGRGVLHDDEVTFAVVAPAAGPFEGSGVTRATARIAGALVLGLRRLGVAVDAARGAPPASPRLRRGACFAAATRQEVVVGRRKLCGSAQFRGRRALLQHGSLPLRFDVARQARLLGADRDVLARKALGLADCLPDPPDPRVVRAALVAGFEEELGVRIAASTLDASEREALRANEAALRADARSFVPAEAGCSA